MTTTLNTTIQPLFTEEDLRSFLREPEGFFQTIKPLLAGATVFVAILVGSYTLFNYNALLRVYETNSTVSATAVTPTQTSPLPIQQQADGSVIAATPSPTIPKDSLSYSGLNISAPVAWDTPFDDTLIAAKLPNTLVHFQGTAKPGQHGMVVITGHSSNYPWIKGLYNTIFAPLEKLKPAKLLP